MGCFLIQRAEQGEMVARAPHSALILEDKAGEMHSIHLVLGMATYRHYVYEIWWVVIPDSKGSGRGKIRAGYLHKFLNEDLVGIQP